jgi:hypothetical protein
VKPAKVCPCCQRGFTADEWARLPLKGIQRGADGDGQEMRDCSCGSTISLPLCWFCQRVVGDGSGGSECDCGAVVCCVDCGPARHACGDGPGLNGGGDSEGHRSAMRDAGRAGELR